MKIGHLNPEEAAEFVHVWMQPGDPTGLLVRAQPIDEKSSPFEVEEVEEPHELVLARESPKKE